MIKIYLKSVKIILIHKNERVPSRQTGGGGGRRREKQAKCIDSSLGNRSVGRCGFNQNFLREEREIKRLCVSIFSKRFFKEFKDTLVLFLYLCVPTSIKKYHCVVRREILT